MSNRVFIVHGWEGYPEEGWFPFSGSSGVMELPVALQSVLEIAG